MIKFFAINMFCFAVYNIFVSVEFFKVFVIFFLKYNLFVFSKYLFEFMYSIEKQIFILIDKL